MMVMVFGLGMGLCLKCVITPRGLIGRKETN